MQILLGADPRLRQKAIDVEKADITAPAMQSFFDELEETMEVADGLGLAAPQVNVPKKIFAVKVLGKTMCLINPEIIDYSKEQILDDEGCLSFPGIFGKVNRSKRITVKALDRDGKAIQLELTNLDARVVQHEHDHLIGILLPDRLKETEKSSQSASALNN